MLEGCDEVTIRDTFCDKQVPGKRLTEEDRACFQAKIKKVLLVGFYGRGNFGDDVMGRALASYVQKSRYCQVSIVTASAEVFAGGLEETALRLPHSLKEVLKALRHCDVLFQGGGTNFHDSFRGRYLIRHWVALAKWVVLFWTARLHGAKVGMVGAGIGPLRHPVSRWLSRAAFAACNSINVRDVASVHELSELDIKKPVHLGFDLAALYVLFKRHRRSFGRKTESPMLGISACTLTPFLNSKEENEKYWQVMGDALAQFIQEKKIRLRFFSLFSGTSAEKDDAVIDLIVSRLPKNISYERYVYTGDVEGFADLFLDCDWFIGTKYHAAMLAYLSGCECAIVSYNRKMIDLAQEIGLPEERHVAANCIQTPEVWQRLFSSFERQVPDVMNAAEGFSKRAMYGLDAVFDSVGLLPKEGLS